MIEIEFEKRMTIVVGIVTATIMCLLILGMIGSRVTPWEAGKAQLLTPARWAELKHRKAFEENRIKMCSFLKELEREVGKREPVRGERLLRKAEALPEFPLLLEAKEKLIKAAQDHLEFALALTEEDKSAELVKALKETLSCDK